MKASRLERYRKQVAVQVKERSFVWLGYYSRPTVLIIGAQKAGTTALHHLLGLHANMVSAAVKEIHFFDKEANYERGVDWYHSHFPFPHQLRGGKYTFECTPKYLYHVEAAKRIAHYNPDLKLIAILRNPIDRAYSAWNVPHWKKKGEGASFFEVVRKEAMQIHKELAAGSEQLYTTSKEPDYLHRGLYYYQLKRYYQYFDHKQIMVIESKALRDQPQDALDSISDFLDIPNFLLAPTDLTFHNQGKYRSIPDEARSFLQQFFEPFNVKLYNLLREAYDWT